MDALIQDIRNAKQSSIQKSTLTFSFENVDFEYENEESVFEKANFKFSNNGLFLFKGNNGTGKTTIFKLLTKFKKPNLGTVTCDTNGTIGYSSANGNDINAYIKCDTFLYDCLGDERRHLLTYALNCLNLQKCKDHRIIELSSGQRKKLSIFRAFTKSQYAMFFDEPLSFLDVTFQQTVLEQIEELKKTMSILIATHANKFNEIADVIYEIRDRKINIYNSESNE